MMSSSLMMSSGLPRFGLEGGTGSLRYKRGHERHGYLPGRGGLTKAVIELHYGKCQIQHFWKLTQGVKVGIY